MKRCECGRKAVCVYCLRCCRRKAHCSGRSAPFVVPRSLPRPDAGRDR